MTRVGLLINNKNRLGGKIAMHVMQECESLEIDSEVDFLSVESMMRSNCL